MILDPANINVASHLHTSAIKATGGACNVISYTTATQDAQELQAQ